MSNCTTRNVATEKTREKNCVKSLAKKFEVSFVFVVIFCSCCTCCCCCGANKLPICPIWVRGACKSQKLLLLLHFRALSARGGYKL